MVIMERGLQLGSRMSALIHRQGAFTCRVFQPDIFLGNKRWYGRKQIKTVASSLRSRPASKLSEKAALSDNIDDEQVSKTRSSRPPSGDSPKSLPSDTDQIVTVFHKPTKHYFNIKFGTPDQGVSLVFKGSDKLVNVDMDDKFWSEVNRTVVSLEEEQKNPGEDPKVQSIDELMWKPIKLNYRKLPVYYMNLSKIRLTGLVVLTSMAGYAMAPGAFHPDIFALCTLGTALTSASANSINQYFEVPYDSQMNRTKNRVLVRGLVSPLHAVGFATAAGLSGLAILSLFVNPLTAMLGAFNLGLYTLVYTPMKRLHIANTWVGSIVGAIPPMMGWTACTGALDPGAWLMGAILYAWQFPHFNSLSWNLRPDYSRAGYQMCSVVNPALCKRVALRYSVGMIGLCTLAPVLDLTTWTFAIDSLPLNLYMTYLSWNFYRNGDSKSSRKLFRFTLAYFPALFILMLISKKSFGDPKKKESVANEVT